MAKMLCLMMTGQRIIHPSQNLSHCMILFQVRANFLWLGHKTNLIKQKTAEEVIEEYIANQQGG